MRTKAVQTFLNIFLDFAHIDWAVQRTNGSFDSQCFLESINFQRKKIDQS
jgi:hypothetical protein